MTMSVTTQSEQETMDLAARIATLLKPGDIVTLDGPLGSGKTCFVRGLARGMGVNPAHVSSPTFILRQEYLSQDGAALTHIDAYRLNGPEELDSIGWDELLESRDSIIVIEWPGRLGAALDGRVTLAIQFEHRSAKERTLELEPAGALRESLEKLLHVETE